jgi:hypothetical protein
MWRIFRDLIMHYLKLFLMSKEIYWKFEERKNQQDATIRCLLLTSVSTCFGHHYDHLQEIKGPVTAFGVYWSGFVECVW